MMQFFYLDREEVEKRVNDYTLKARDWEGKKISRPEKITRRDKVATWEEPPNYKEGEIREYYALPIGFDIHYLFINQPTNESKETNQSS